MQRFGLTLVFAGLLAVLGTVAQLLLHGISAGQSVPYAPAVLAVVAGALLCLGMVLIERGRPAPAYAFSG